MHWGGLSNGMLLQRAETEFDVFITGDTNLTFQQNLIRFNIAVIVLEAGSTRLVDTAKLMPRVKTILKTIQAGQVVRVGPGS
jgi:putative NIF3 family GTP cyclohydrolase 1 type 2